MTWISVQDRLPEPDRPVLVASDGNKYAICTGYRDRNGVLRFAYQAAHPPDLDPVTHWMPLPDPPVVYPRTVEPINVP